MSIASRVGDNHVCPAVTAGVPHVGGPILGVGEATILIGGKTAAHQQDKALCTGPPDVIVGCEPSVLMGTSGAVRAGDMTAHGGVIIGGEPSVLIGSTTLAAALCEAAAAGTALVQR